MRAPAQVVVDLLRREAERTGDERLRITAASLRNWKRRGHISGQRGYDLGEVLSYLDGRSGRGLRRGELTSVS